MKNNLVKLCLFIFSINLQGQVKINVTSYNSQPKKGIYQTKNLLYPDKEVNRIEPQFKFIKGRNPQFIYVENQPIFLYKNKNGKGKPISYLSETSIVEVDTIFYNQVFQDTSQA